MKKCLGSFLLKILCKKEGGKFKVKEIILSVGIDIGTATTQLIFSKITVCNTAGAFSIPNIKITDKKIIYKSKIYFTPLVSDEKIDFIKIKKIISAEYKNALIEKEDIRTGAIIITGETARKENAEEVLAALSEFAGDFVVETAGADLEAILAGFGAGASEVSKKTREKVVNFDIGGGTTNSVAFKDGEVIDAFALNIGGRLIRFNEDFSISYISKKILPILKSLNLNFAIGSIPDFNELVRVTNFLASTLLKIVKNEELDEVGSKLFIEHNNKVLTADKVMFSGGVSEFVYSYNDVNEISELMEYGDIGPLLGWSIRNIFQEHKLKIIEPKEKIRATVIGAGSHSMAISGSTIVFDDEILPVKNVPIVKLSEGSKGIIINNIINKTKLYENSNIALAFKGEKSPSYEEVKAIGGTIVEALKNRSDPIIVIVENDFAKALGQTIKNIVNDSKKVICIDGIKVENGDYVDIGKSISSVVPVVIKTLIFNL